ncbi:ankyrin repeat domain-containing protein [Ramlibacter algicola]|uniref:ankyrin repeat domain-containing protein n=1 Tax=Ramlibacter algicola TaxID=2795217 RepID=UPI00308421A8
MKMDDVATVQQLVARGFDPNTPTPDGQTGLVMALREPSPKVAGLLARLPATQVELRTPQDESPLMMAALKGQEDAVKVLLARGADVNKTGWAPLHYAASNGNVAIVKLLLEHHAYIDAESPNGTTPLMMAAMYGSTESVEVLLEEGADWKLKNQQGMTALDFAVRGERPDAVRILSATMEGRPVPPPFFAPIVPKAAPRQDAPPVQRPGPSQPATPEAVEAVPQPRREPGRW